jgi:ABC-type sugar transport system ATPase subunit
MSTVSEVCLRDVVVRYPRKDDAALQVSDLRVAAGEVLAVVGVSGSGKSTLLRTVAGFIRPGGVAGSGPAWLRRLVAPANNTPMSGAVFFDSRDVSALSPRSRRVAYATQALNLYPHMTAFENMAFPLRMARQGASEVQRRVLETARRLHIDQLLGRRPNELSGGEQQRVALGKALVQDASVFLFDEPLSSIDAPLRAAFRKDLRGWLRQPRRTSFYVTHDLDEAFAVADRVAVLHQGDLLQVGTPGELYKHPVSLTVARLVWGGRTTVLEGELEGTGRAAKVKVGDVYLNVDAGHLSPNGTSVWVAAPREAFRLLPEGVEHSDRLMGHVTDVRFAAASYVVDVAGQNFSLEVAVNGGETPTVGRRVAVTVNPEHLRLYPRPPRS